MTTSLSFDRAADFYDSTRELPLPVATDGIKAIMSLAGQGAKLLDVGTGTGRVSVPLLERGVNLFGCDLSTKMMRRLLDKFPSARLTQADATRLPFPTHHFDALLTCHVMHLVDPWREALNEYRRVLKHGGIYINARTEHTGTSVREEVRSHWRDWITAQGWSWQRPGVKEIEHLHEALLVMGAELRMIEVVHFTRSITLHEVVDGLANRVFSLTWQVPDDLLSESIQDLTIWIENTYGGLDQETEDQAVFVLDVARF